MQRQHPLTSALVLALYFQMTTPPPAQAYFDATTGAYLIQMVFGFGAAVWIVLRGAIFKMRGKKMPDQAAAETPAGERAGATEATDP